MCETLKCEVEVAGRAVSGARGVVRRTDGRTVRGSDDTVGRCRHIIRSPQLV